MMKLRIGEKLVSLHFLYFLKSNTNVIHLKLVVIIIDCNNIIFH